MKKKKTVRIIVILGVAAVLVAAGVLFVPRLLASQASATGASYSIVTITTGDLEKNIVGTGTIAISDRQSVTADYAMALSSIQVKVGQSVAAGDVVAVLDTDSLDEVLATLAGELTALDQQIGNYARSYSSTGKLLSPSSGRVKLIYATQGDNAQDVVAASGAVMVLSLDGKMMVRIPAGSLSVGDTAAVVDGSTTYDAVVASVADGVATVTFSDKTTEVGAAVTVMVDGETVGSGEALIHLPLAITDARGTLDTIYVSVNSAVSRNGNLAYLTNMQPSDEYADAVARRQETYDEIQQIKALQQAGVIVSPIDGIVSALTAAEGQNLMAGAEILSLYVGDATQMVINVDELDITSVAVGQKAVIAMDAVAGKAYEAEVAFISQVGTSNSGVTNYAVTLNVSGDDSLKIGMNGTATITVESREDVVLVPMLALQTMGSGQFVWLYDENAGEGSEVPGVRTEVTTGLSNDAYAQVLTGLSAGDRVIIVRTGTQNSDMQGMFGFGNAMTGGEFTGGTRGEMPNRPQGGDIPQGGN